MAQSRIVRRLKLQLIAGMACALCQPLTAGSAHAAKLIGFFGAGRCAVGQKDFSDVAACMSKSVENVPGLLTALAYLFGLLLGAMAIVKMKEHVENPVQTPLKDSAIRMAAGGALFALPIVFEAMLNTTGANGAGVWAAALYKSRFNVR